MRNKDPITAAELMAKLQNDPEYQKRKAEKEQRRRARQRAYDQALEPYLKEINKVGYNCQSLQELVRNYSPLPRDVVNILLSALPTLSEPRVLETVIRALGAAEKPFDGRSLARCFDSTSDESLKFAIANTIALTHPHSIEDWLVNLRKSSEYWDKVLQQLQT